MVSTTKRATIAPGAMRLISRSEKTAQKYNELCAELPGLAGANGLRLAQMLLISEQALTAVEMPDLPSYAALIESDRGRVVEGEWRNYGNLRDNLSDEEISDLQQWYAEMEN